MSTRGLSVQSMGWGKQVIGGTDAFKSLSEEFMESRDFKNANEDFKEYVKTSNELQYSGIQEKLMLDEENAQGQLTNAFYNVEVMLSDAQHFETADMPYGISATLAYKNSSEVIGDDGDDCFGLRNVTSTTNKKLAKAISSIKEIGYGDIILELYKRQQTGKQGINYGTPVKDY